MLIISFVRDPSARSVVPRLRTVTVSTTDCWNCGQNVNIAMGNKDGEALEQDYFSTEETTFVRENGVTLERRYSTTAGGKYLANICVNPHFPYQPCRAYRNQQQNYPM